MGRNLGLNKSGESFAGLLVFWLVLAFVFCHAAGVEAAGFSIRSPQNGVWVNEKKLSLAGSGAKSKSVSVTGVEVIGSKGSVPVQEGGVFGALIELSPGMNSITVAAGKDNAVVKVFYTPDPKKKSPPRELKRLYTHDNANVLNCKECHRLRKGNYDFKKIVPARSNCTTKCHQDMGKAKHVHGPVGAGVCISCHSPHGTTEPSFIQRTGQELCTVCHQARKEEFEQKVVHSPVEEGCVDCHNPHESEMRFQLNATGDSVSALCYNCHEEGIFMKANKHGPVEEGDCIACHRPHSSSNNSLLIAPLEAGALCFECHEDSKEEFVMEYVHAPVEESCAECHDPHSGEAQYMLKRSGGELCKMCHEDATPEIYEAINSAKVKHPPVDEGNCVACHRVHSSNYASILNDSLEKLCLSCHDELGDTIAESTNRHGPVKTGDCTACHNVHGAQFTKLLARYYPTNFYTGYGPEKYDLCFGCHNKDIARTKNTDSLTNFRDGTYNLHFFHVNSEKGRTCTACHDPHASNQAKHIRYEVPFGAWSYPISMTIEKNGGGCVVGCHAPKQYDRVKPKIKPSR